MCCVISRKPWSGLSLIDLCQLSDQHVCVVDGRPELNSHQQNTQILDFSNSLVVQACCVARDN